MDKMELYYDFLKTELDVLNNVLRRLVVPKYDYIHDVRIRIIEEMSFAAIRITYIAPKKYITITNIHNIRVETKLICDMMGVNSDIFCTLTSGLYRE